MRRAWARAALAAALSAAFGANADEVFTRDGRQFQYLSVLTNDGAQCTLQRGGKLLAPLVFPQHDERVLSDGALVDLTESKADILVTCSLGGRSLSQTIRFGPVEYIARTTPCVTSLDHNAEADRAAEECLKRQQAMHWTAQEYPQITRLLFDITQP